MNDDDIYSECSACGEQVWCAAVDTYGNPIINEENLTVTCECGAEFTISWQPKLYKIHDDD